MKDLKIACLIMASGMSMRFGSNKLLAPLGGRLLVDYAIENANLGLFSDRLLITRSPETFAHCKTLLKTILHDFPTKAETVRLGVEKILEDGIIPDGIIFLQADQPFLTEGTLKQLCETFASNKNKICRLSYQGEPCSPVIFPKSLYEELMNIGDGKGGTYVIKKHPEIVECLEVENFYEIFDVDVKEDIPEAERIINAELKSLFPLLKR